MNYPMMTCFAVMISVLSVFGFGYGFYHGIDWIIILTDLACLVGGVIGFVFSVGVALAGNKHPTKAELNEFGVLFFLGFYNTIAIFGTMVWLLYKNS